jgi:hypothetical protein
MTRAYFTITLFYLITFVSYAQVYETNPDYLRVKNWTFGENQKLVFEADSIIQLHSEVLQTEACASFSNRSGELLFYSDGIHIYDSSNNKIFNIKGDQSALQGVIIFGDDSITYISTVVDIGRGFAHFYILENENLQKQIILKKACELQSVVNRQNQKDYWLVIQEFQSNKIYLFPIDNNKILHCPTIMVGNDYFGDKSYMGIGGAKFSNSGKILIINNYLNNEVTFSGNSSVYSFDSELGKINLKNTINGLQLPTYLEISRDDKQVFISERRHISQFTFNSKNTDIYSTRKLLYTVKGDNRHWPILQKYHNDVFFGETNLFNLGRISLIDGEFFLDSSYLNLKNKLSYGLPNFNASYFHTPSVDFAYTEDCWRHQYEFEGRDTLKATEWKWIFTKNSFRDSVATKHCNYIFPDTGKWLVSHIAITATRQDTITKTLTVVPKFDHDFLGKDTFYCQGETINLTLRVPSDMHCVHWNNEEPNLDEELGAIIDYQHFHTDTLHIDTAGIYTVRITNKTFCQAWDTLKVTEASLPPKPIISYETKKLASTIVATTYRWFLDGQYLTETTERSYKPIAKGHYQVQLLSEYGCPSPLSDSFLVDTLISIEKLEKEELFSIYPNPSDGNITIQAMQNIDYQVAVYDMLGKLILQKLNAKSIFIDQKGSYVVKISTESGVWSRVVMVE